MNEWRPKQRPPASTATLHRWIADHSRASSIGAARLQRRISFMAVAGALDRVRDERNEHRFVIKGGVAMELRDPTKARTTRDLDAAYRGADQDIHALLDEAFGSPIGDFTFEIAGTPYEHPDIDLVVVDVRVQYRARAFQRVKLELKAAERSDSGDVELVPAFAVSEYGIDGLTEVACLPLAAQLAQKLHACTIGYGADDRARDLVDIILIRDMLVTGSLAEVRATCARVFSERGTGDWPPTISVRESWRPLYAKAIDDLDFPIAELADAVARVAEIVAEIDAANMPPLPS